MSLEKSIRRSFDRLYGTAPSVVVRAPGRVNLIGEHTDYNDGFVLPMAIDRAAWIALRPRTDSEVHVHSLDFDETVTFSLNDLQQSNSKWAEYIKGVAWALGEHGRLLTGWDGVVAGDVPIGAGLSSSAALELATARAFASISPIQWDAAEMARIGQQAENEWVGVSCGIMDQMISAAGQAGHALLIDCRSLETQAVPLPPGTAVVVLDTATRRGLVGSAYNERRAQCEAAAQHFGVKALRDVTLPAFDTRANELDEVARRRARHVISENARTLQAVEAMRQGNAAELGRLMDASHVSLRDDFEVSNDALNTIVECAQREDVCYGARMTGAGFGGCAVALVQASAAEGFATRVADDYRSRMGLSASVYVCQASEGASVV
jgi:galactokinase